MNARPTDALPAVADSAMPEQGFVEALAVHDAEVAANALRKAAEDSYDHIYANSVSFREYLTRRADRIEREATNPELGSSEGSDR